MVDKFGQQIIAGDFVAIGVRSGNCGGLSVGKVLETKADSLTVEYIDDYGSKTKGRPQTSGNIIVINDDTLSKLIERHK